MSFPITPDPSIHNLPPAEQAHQNQLTQQSLSAFGQQLIQTIVNAVLSLISGGLLGHGGSGFFGILNSIPVLGTFSTLFQNLLGLFGFGGSGSPITNLLGNILPSIEGIPVLGPILAAFLGPVESIFGGPLPGGTNSIGGFFNIFTDVLSVFGLGSSSGLGTGSPTPNGSIGGIPFLGPLFNGFISLFSGTGSGLSGLTNVFSDFLGLLGAPAGLGSGSPTVTPLPLSATGLLGNAQTMFQVLADGLGYPGGSPVSSTAMQGVAGTVAAAASSAFQTATGVSGLLAAQTGVNNSNGGVGGIAVAITPTGAPGAVWS